jgi:hypothetical protein
MQMNEALVGSMSLVNASGYVIIALILTLLLLAVGLTFFVRARYAAIERELQRQGEEVPDMASAVLSHIMRDVEGAARRRSGEINTQAIIENRFQSDLAPLMLAERFIKSATGLMIIMGLVGTFYGLTLSIGKLGALLSEDAGITTDVVASVTMGLTQALSGMSVAFSTSLFGIAGAILMTLLGVFANVPERRLALMVRLEDYVDNVLRVRLRGVERELGDADSEVTRSTMLERAAASFGQAVSQLDGTITRFETALQGFSTSTRDFRELNMHLKDNIQRMSLSFADLGDTLKHEVEVLRTRERNHGGEP